MGKKSKNGKAKSFFADFKEFISKGNVLDMAVGIIIGGAFGKIVSSLVSDIISPIIGLITGNPDLTDLKILLKPEALDAEGNVLAAESAILYGQFLQFILDFLIVAFFIFLFIRLIAKMKEKSEKAKAAEQEEAAAEEPEPEPEPSKEEILLTEIRDLLKSNRK